MHRWTLIREQPHPAKASQNPISLVCGREITKLVDLGDEITLFSRGSPGCILLNLCPCHPLLQSRLVFWVDPSKINKGVDHSRVAFVSKRPPNHGVSLWYTVGFTKGNRVSVCIGDKRVSIQDMVRLGRAHQVLVGDLNHLSIAEEGCRVILG